MSQGNEEFIQRAMSAPPMAEHVGATMFRADPWGSSYLHLDKTNPRLQTHHDPGGMPAGLSANPKVVVESSSAMMTGGGIVQPRPNLGPNSLAAAAPLAAHATGVPPMLEPRAHPGTIGTPVQSHASLIRPASAEPMHRPTSVVDLIQADFPRTPSPIFGCGGCGGGHQHHSSGALSAAAAAAFAQLERPKSASGGDLLGAAGGDASAFSGAAGRAGGVDGLGSSMAHLAMSRPSASPPPPPPPSSSGISGYAPPPLQQQQQHASYHSQQQQQQVPAGYAPLHSTAEYAQQQQQQGHAAHLQQQHHQQQAHPPPEGYPEVLYNSRGEVVGYAPSNAAAGPSVGAPAYQQQRQQQQHLHLHSQQQQQQQQQGGQGQARQLIPRILPPQPPANEFYEPPSGVGGMGSAGNAASPNRMAALQGHEVVGPGGERYVLYAAPAAGGGQTRTGGGGCGGMPLLPSQQQMAALSADDLQTYYSQLRQQHAVYAIAAHEQQQGHGQHQQHQQHPQHQQQQQNQQHHLERQQQQQQQQQYQQGHHEQRGGPARFGGVSSAGDGGSGGGGLYEERRYDNGNQHLGGGGGGRRGGGGSSSPRSPEGGGGKGKGGGGKGGGGKGGGGGGGGVDDRRPQHGAEKGGAGGGGGKGEKGDPRGNSRRRAAEGQGQSQGQGQGGSGGGGGGRGQGQGGGSDGSSSLLDEFRASGGKGRNWELSHLRGGVVGFCQDQHGSRFVQQKLEVATFEEKELVFSEVLPLALESLVSDVFGNYVVQKLLQHGSPNQRGALITTVLSGHAVRLSLEIYGCRVVQKALEVSCWDPEVLVPLVREFGGAVLECVHDQNGNHVIQKCIEVMSADRGGGGSGGGGSCCRRDEEGENAATTTAASGGGNTLSEHLEFVLDSFQGQVRELSMHPYGCRVIQRVLEHCVKGQRFRILDELMLEFNSTSTGHKPSSSVMEALIKDQYGNYVVQHVIQYGREKDRATVVARVRKDLFSFAQHKFASNVVEKCLQFGGAHNRTQIIDEIIVAGSGGGGNGPMPPSSSSSSSSMLMVMIRDQYANYVIQKVIDLASERQLAGILDRLRPDLTAVRRCTYGKHILLRLERASGLKLDGNGNSASFTSPS